MHKEKLKPFLLTDPLTRMRKSWYRVDKSRLSEELQQKFVQLEPDDETKEFLSNSIDKSSWVWTQIWYLLAKAVLKHFWTITDING
ncbi:unnamed protein product [Euphydryas editha]|uniref:Uncharacterized protein n=1 Tax=Euphydryas editha TaxID=104508 RepID=A0AAU9U0L8_EUPED|nr:unnamed protein product [Euphydryas editha]